MILVRLNVSSMYLLSRDLTASLASTIRQARAGGRRPPSIFAHVNTPYCCSTVCPDTGVNLVSKLVPSVQFVFGTEMAVMTPCSESVKCSEKVK